MAYSDKVVDHYENPRNVGTLDKSASEVGTGLVGATQGHVLLAALHAADMRTIDLHALGYRLLTEAGR